MSEEKNNSMKKSLILIGLTVLVLGAIVMVSSMRQDREVVKIQDEQYDPIASKEDLIANDWILVNMTGDAIPSEVKVTAKFEDSGRLSGNSGCNQYNGSFTVDANSIDINENMAMTLMGCEGLQADIESEYTKLLPTSEYYSITDGKLYLLDSNRESIMEYDAIGPLAFEGTSWNAISVNNGNQGVVSLTIGTEITAVFNDDGTVNGNSGCNSYSGSYEYDSDAQSIMFGPMAATKMFCAEPEDVMDQEQNYLNALSNTTVYQVNEDRLEFRDDSGALQVNFNPAK